MTPSWTVVELHELRQLLTMKNQGIAVHLYLYALLDAALRNFSKGLITEGTLLRMHRWSGALKEIYETLDATQMLNLINGRLPEGDEYIRLRETLARPDIRVGALNGA